MCDFDYNELIMVYYLRFAYKSMSCILDQMLICGRTYLIHYKKMSH